MDYLDRIAKTSNDACRIIAQRQPYVFWLDDLASIQVEVAHVPRITWRKEIERACSLWGNEIALCVNVPEQELASQICCFYAKSRQTLGFLISPAAKPATYDVHVFRKWEV